MSIHESAEARLRSLFDDHRRRVYAYVARHVDAHTAQDLVADVFVVAWRRIDEVPEQALPWLLVVARNMVANSARSGRRRDRLATTVARLEALSPEQESPEATVIERAELMAALAQLTAFEREAVLLTAWDGLTAQQAALVAGCSTRAFEVRLSRARARLARALTAVPPDRSGGPQKSHQPHDEPHQADPNDREALA